MEKHMFFVFCESLRPAEPAYSPVVRDVLAPECFYRVLMMKASTSSHVSGSVAALRHTVLGKVIGTPPRLWRAASNMWKSGSRR